MACLTLTTPRAMRSHSNGGGRAADVTARPLRLCVFVYSFEKWNNALARKKLGDEGGTLTVAGRRFLTEFGVVLTPATGQRIFCRPCLDWSERPYHIAGHLGSELRRVCVERGWLARQRGSRALRVTAAGRRGFLTSFGVELPAAGTWK